jgi:hypothetical protein
VIGKSGEKKRKEKRIDGYREARAALVGRVFSTV